MDNLVDVEFFQKNCSVLVKHLYVLYFLSGAIYDETYMRIKFRRFLLVYFCIGYLVCSIPPFKPLILHFELEHIFTAVGFLSFIHCSVLNAYLLHSNRNEFHRLFDLITEYSNEPTATIDTDDSNRQRNDYFEETNLLKVCFRIYQGLISWLLTIYLGKMSGKMLFSSGPAMVIENHDFVIPYLCSACNTTSSYMLAFNSSFFLGLPFPLVQGATLGLFTVLSMYLKNRAVVLRNDIIFNSDAVREKFENYDELEEQELKRANPSDFQQGEISRLRKRRVREYMSQVQRWIRNYQQLIRHIKQYQKCAGKIIDWMVVLVFFTIINLGYLSASNTIDDGKYMNQFSGYAIIYFLMFLICCRLGNDLNDVSEIISDAVYSTPWYHLSAKEQKVILTFLTLSQRTVTLNVFGAFSLCLERIPAKLNDIYGYIQIMRLLTMRSKYIDIAP